MRKPGATLTGLSISSAPFGRVGHLHARRVDLLGRIVGEQPALGLGVAPDSGAPNALATQAEVMSSWVGPMPPVVNTCRSAAGRR